MADVDLVARVTGKLSEKMLAGTEKRNFSHQKNVFVFWSIGNESLLSTVFFSYFWFFNQSNVRETVLFDQTMFSTEQGCQRLWGNVHLLDSCVICLTTVELPPTPMEVLAFTQKLYSVSDSNWGRYFDVIFPLNTCSVGSVRRKSAILFL